MLLNIPACSRVWGRGRRVREERRKDSEVERNGCRIVEEGRGWKRELGDAVVGMGIERWKMMGVERHINRVEDKD